MDLLLSDNLIPLSRRPGDRLFFDQYRYVVSFYLKHSSALRNMPNDIDQAKEYVTERLDWVTRRQNHGGNWGSSRVSLGSAQKENNASLAGLLNLVALLLPNRDKMHLMVSVNWGYVYTSDLELVKNLYELPGISVKKIKEAVVDRPRDSIKISNPKFSKRSYFKDTWISMELKNTIGNYLRNQENIRISPSLMQLFTDAKPTTKRALLGRHHFVEYNDESILLMLGLIAPGLIRRTVAVIAK